MLLPSIEEPPKFIKFQRHHNIVIYDVVASKNGSWLPPGRLHGHAGRRPGVLQEIVKQCVSWIRNLTSLTPEAGLNDPGGRRVKRERVPAPETSSSSWPELRLTLPGSIAGEHLPVMGHCVPLNFP